MQPKWTKRALEDRDEIFAYIAWDNLEAATRLDVSFDDRVDELSNFPEMGRRGKRAGTRELVMAPYIVIYRVTSSGVTILRVLHGARKR